MKKYLLLFGFSSLLAFTFCSKNNVKLNIEVIANNLPEGSKIYVTGNDDQLGNWQPNEIELNKIEKDKWSKIFSFQKGKKLEFKFTRGSWADEALNDDASIPVNHTIDITNDTSISYAIKLWADQVEKKIEGQITGNVQYHRNFQGNGIKPRDIIVWLPPGYDSELDKSYPVFYIHDGQNIVDPQTSAFQVDLQIDEAADSLIKQELIEPLIIVGIYNTTDRGYEYSEGKLGSAYMNFIVDSLKPFIDRNYRSKKDRRNTANGGASLGGLISFMLIWDHNEVFSKTACFSPAFKIDNYDFVDNVTSYKGMIKKIKLYIHNGDSALDSTLQPGVDEMLEVLKQQGYAEGINFYFQKGENSLHSEGGWAKSIWRALTYLFGTEKGKSLL